MEGCNVWNDDLHVSENLEDDRMSTYGTMGCIRQHMECQNMERLRNRVEFVPFPVEPEIVCEKKRTISWFGQECLGPGRVGEFGQVRPVRIVVSQWRRDGNVMGRLRFEGNLPLQIFNLIRFGLVLIRLSWTLAIFLSFPLSPKFFHI